MSCSDAPEQRCAGYCSVCHLQNEQLVPFRGTANGRLWKMRICPDCIQANASEVPT